MMVNDGFEESQSEKNPKAEGVGRRRGRVRKLKHLNKMGDEQVKMLYLWVL